jgi:hypothetical protein
MGDVDASRASFNGYNGAVLSGEQAIKLNPKPLPQQITKFP